MNIGREIDTRIVTPVRHAEPAQAPKVPKRDWRPARPAHPVQDPDKVPTKTPTKK